MSSSARDQRKEAGGFWFDKAAADRVCRFFEQRLQHEGVCCGGLETFRVRLPKRNVPGLRTALVPGRQGIGGPR